MKIVTATQTPLQLQSSHIFTIRYNRATTRIVSPPERHHQQQVAQDKHHPRRLPRKPFATSFSFTSRGSFLRGRAWRNWSITKHPFGPSCSLPFFGRVKAFLMPWCTFDHDTCGINVNKNYSRESVPRFGSFCLAMIVVVVVMVVATRMQRRLATNHRCPPPLQLPSTVGTRRQA